MRVFDFSATSQHCPRWHQGLIHYLAARNGVAVATAGGRGRGCGCMAGVGAKSGCCALFGWDASSGCVECELGHTASSMPQSRQVAQHLPAMRARAGRVTPPHSHVHLHPQSFDTTVPCCLRPAGDDCVARLWDAARGEFKAALGGHRTAIRWAEFSADGRQLATVSPDRMVKVWDVETAECVHTMPGAASGAMVWVEGVGRGRRELGKTRENSAHCYGTGVLLLQCLCAAAAAA